ncbi:unnamed protein product [Ectocarpus sp. 4 AP-2014]
MRPEHSENTYLQCLLLEVGFQDMKDEMRKRYEAKPLVTRIGEKIREYRLVMASGKPSIILVVLAVIFAFVAVILATTEVHALLEIRPFACLEFILDCALFDHPVNVNEPSTSLADWSEVILKIQQVEGSDRIVPAEDSGEETLDVLMGVLMDDRKIGTETSEEAQVPDELATQSIGTQTSGSAVMPDDGSSRNSQSLGKTEEPTSSPSTSDPEIESDIPVSISYILGYSALLVLLAICGVVVWAVAAFLKVGSRVFAAAWKCSSLFS